MKDKVKVAVNGYGVIGKRVADAVQLQDDMELAGVCDVVSDWRIKVAVQREYPVYAFDGSTQEKMEQAGIEVRGTLAELLKRCDVVVDCTPKKIAAQNIEKYKEAGLKFIVQGARSTRLPATLLALRITMTPLWAGNPHGLCRATLLPLSEP
ncbi:hypothetical protein GCM10028895_53280 [Pontibacter rugosus]